MRFSREFRGFRHFENESHHGVIEKLRLFLLRLCRPAENRGKRQAQHQHRDTAHGFAFIELGIAAEAARGRSHLYLDIHLRPRLDRRQLAMPLLGYSRCLAGTRWRSKVPSIRNACLRRSPPLRLQTAPQWIKARKLLVFLDARLTIRRSRLTLQPSPPIGITPPWHRQPRSLQSTGWRSTGWRLTCMSASPRISRFLRGVLPSRTSKVELQPYHST